jgi:hypothetical protein
VDQQQPLAPAELHRRSRNSGVALSVVGLLGKESTSALGRGQVEAHAASTAERSASPTT